MPIDYTVDTENQIVYATASGDLLPEDLLTLQKRIAAAELRSRPQLIDARGANLELTTEYVRILVTH
jgi:hypothetical protein